MIPTAMLPMAPADEILAATKPCLWPAHERERPAASRNELTYVIAMSLGASRRARAIVEKSPVIVHGLGFQTSSTSYESMT